MNTTYEMSEHDLWDLLKDYVRTCGCRKEAWQVYLGNQGHGEDGY